VKRLLLLLTVVAIVVVMLVVMAAPAFAQNLRGTTVTADPEFTSLTALRTPQTEPREQAFSDLANQVPPNPIRSFENTTSGEGETTFNTFTINHVPPNPV
jgi:hypothetical protein